MTDTPSRMFGLVCVLILIWVGVYWLYEPRSGRGGIDTPPVITRDDTTPVSIAPVQQPEPSQPAASPPVVDASPPPTNPAPQPESPRTRVVPPEFREYVVQRGDVSFEAVAQRVYNDRRKWDIIARANPFVTSDRLKPGRTVLKLPVDPDNIQGKLVTDTGGAPAAAQPAPSPGETTYVIQADDTLWSIAKKVYGRGASWRLIYDANRDVIKDPDRPVAGTVLKVPPKPKD
jgi:nucleoid-associated protein YgaU